MTDDELIGRVMGWPKDWSVNVQPGDFAARCRALVKEARAGSTAQRDADGEALRAALVELLRICLACDLERPTGDIEPPTEDEYNAAMDAAEAALAVGRDKP